MNILCSIGKHKFVPDDHTGVAQPKAFLDLMEKMIPDSNGELYKYVFKALVDKFNQPEDVTDLLCIKCGKVKYKVAQMYGDITEDINKKIREYDGIQKMKEADNNLHTGCSCCDK
jgi:hypothetical protein